MGPTWWLSSVMSLLVAGVANGIDADCELMLNVLCAAGTTSVDLRDCGLVDADASFVQQCVDNAGRDGLVSLLLDWNEFEQPPNTLLFGLDHLEYLDFSFNDLTLVAEGTFSGIENVEALKLNNNALDNLEPETFDGLDKLRFLYVEDEEVEENGSFCSNGLPGVQRRGACCSEECGACGGTGCAGRTGGPEACCQNRIRNSRVMCSASGAAPCLVDDD